MEKQLVPIEKIVADGVAVFESVKDKVTGLAEQYKTLTVTDINDNKQLKKVSEARKELKRERIEIENQAKEIRKSIKEVTDKVSAKEKELLSIIEPVETQLEEEEKRVEAERERIRLEAVRKEEERVQGRMKAITATGAVFNGISYKVGTFSMSHLELLKTTDEDFEELVEMAKHAAEVEQKRLEKEEAEREEQRRLEEERLRKEQEAREEEQRKIAEEQERMRKEREELERLRREQEEREQKIRDEEERLKQERERMEREEEERKERERKEAEKNAHKQTVHLLNYIYVTNNTSPEKNAWCLYNGVLCRFTDPQRYAHDDSLFKPIIETTDPTLIADGITEYVGKDDSEVHPIVITESNAVEVFDDCVHAAKGIVPVNSGDGAFTIVGAFEKLLRDHAEWSAQTFPMGTALGALIHAGRELEEVRFELAKPSHLFNNLTAAMEYADLIFCVMDSARRAGVSIEDIIDAGRHKLERNKHREWKYNGDGSYSHITKH